jgi:hypothetical protein
MARPGYTLRVGAEAATAVGLIEQAFVQRGYKMKTAPGTLPAELGYGSAGINFVTDVVSDIGLPLFALPSLWKKRHAMKVRIYELEPAQPARTLRIDMRSAEISARATSYFIESVGIAVENLRAQGLCVDIEGPTDSAAAQSVRTEI